MKLKIISTEKTLFEWDILEVVVPTKDWEIGILPQHAVYAWVVKWWLCKFKPVENNDDFLKKDDYTIISIWDGVVYTDWKNVSIAVSNADSKIDFSEEELEEQRKKLEKEIEQIKATWSVEEIEKSLLMMNKVLADIELKKL